MEELKKCPFCGGEAKVKMKNKDYCGLTIYCECENCYAKLPGYCPNMKDENRALDSIFNCKKQAMQAWNRRVEE